LRKKDLPMKRRDLLPWKNPRRSLQGARQEKKEDETMPEKGAIVAINGPRTPELEIPP
jgi:hypothetical protein